jgi:hypothetical protein
MLATVWINSNGGFLRTPPILPAVNRLVMLDHQQTGVVDPKRRWVTYRPAANVKPLRQDARSTDKCGEKNRRMLADISELIRAASWMGDYPRLGFSEIGILSLLTARSAIRTDVRAD